MYTHLVPPSTRTKRRRKPDPATTEELDAPKSDSCVATLSAAWHVPGREVIASVAPSGHFFYMLPPSVDDALFLVAAAGIYDRHLFYMIERDRPVYAFLDFDCQQPDAFTPDSWAAAVRRGIVLFSCFVDALFTRHIAEPGWRMYDASTDTKWSAHAHSRILFASVRELRDVISRFCVWLHAHKALAAPFFFRKPPSARTGVSGIGCIIDSSVYTERPFRLPLNRKKVGIDNWLRPAYGTAPLAAAIDEIRVGFIHPPAGAAVEPLPTIEAVLDVRRTLLATLRTPAADASAQIDAALHGVWRPPPLATEHTTQTDAAAMSGAERSLASGLIEMAALHHFRGRPLSEWPQRTQVVEVAREWAGSMLRVAAAQVQLDGVALEPAADEAELCRAFGFVALVLRAPAWTDAPDVDINAWLDGHCGACVPAAIDQAAAWTAWRREAHQTLLLPENAIMLDCLRLTDASPFDRPSK
jgi:hypothetical protein